MPEQAHRVMQDLRPQRDEEILDLVRETLAQLNKLGDRLESYIREEDSGAQPDESSSTDQALSDDGGDACDGDSPRGIIRDQGSV